MERDQSHTLWQLQNGMMRQKSHYHWLEQRRDGNASGRQRMEIHISFSVILSLRQYKHPDGNIKEAVKHTGSQYGGEGKLRGPLGPSV